MDPVANSLADHPRAAGGAILPTGTYGDDRLRVKRPPAASQAGRCSVAEPIAPIVPAAGDRLRGLRSSLPPTPSAGVARWQRRGANRPRRWFSALS